MLTALSHEMLLKTANKIPPLPQSVVRLSQLFADPDYSVRDVVRAIELDPSLGGSLLRMANSSMYGLGSTKTVNQAIVKLGSGTVKAVAISSSVKPSPDIDLSPFGLTHESYWEHSVSTLCFAETLASLFPRIFNDELASAALLHDFGKLVLAQHISPEHMALLDRMSTAIPMVERERQVLSVDHAEVTAVVAQSWNLPEEVVKCVQHHHSPEGFDHPLTHGLILANHFAWQLEGREQELELEAERRSYAVDALSFTQEDLDTVLANGTARLEQTVSMYQ